MARAGYCSACGQNVYVNADGSCVNGHAATYVSNTYEVPGAVPAAGPPASAIPYAAPVTSAPPKKKRTGLVIALVIVGLLLLCGCGIGTFFLLAANSSDPSGPSSSSQPVTSATDRAKLEAALTLVKSMAKGDGELMKRVMPAATIVAMPVEFWDEFVASTATGASVLGKETRMGATITIATQSNKGSGTITLKISATDPAAVDVHNVRGDKSTSDSVVKLGDEGGKWKVLSLTTGGTTIPFDAEGLKAFIAANQ